MRMAALVAGAMLVVACGGDDPTDSVDGVELAAGFGMEVLVEGLDGPTQISHDGSGGFVLAELNGGEQDGLGQVLAFGELATGAGELLVGELLTPTGVTVDLDGRLWIMEQRRLTAGPLDDPAERDVVRDELPFNSRSEGTLTALGSGAVLYNTSGRIDRDDPSRMLPDHGVLWSIADPSADSEMVATGLRHAYAHVVDRDGQLWSTELVDGTLDGAVPPDELVRIAVGDDFAFPRCVGDRTPVEEHGADDETCASSPRSHALFEPRATPTSVAVAPWDGETMVVALWNRGEIVVVPRSEDGTPHEPEVIVSGDLVPQHLLADGDRLLVTDFAGGRVLSLWRT